MRPLSRELLRFLSNLVTESIFSAPSATLINGLGRYSGGPESDLAVITVTQGKRSATNDFVTSQILTFTF
jgi:hypothetical protein